MTQRLTLYGPTGIIAHWEADKVQIEEHPLHFRIFKDGTDVTRIYPGDEHTVSIELNRE